MQMSEQEICKEYREAKDPNHQLTILAQLNACGTGDILSILEKNNEPLRKRPYQRSQKPEKVSPKKEVKEDIPDSVLKAVQDRMSVLDAEFEKYSAVFEEITKEYKQLDRFIKKYRKKGKPNDKRNDVCEAPGAELPGGGKEEGKTEEIQ